VHELKQFFGIVAINERIQIDVREEQFANDDSPSVESREPDSNVKSERRSQ
jgi:hypothetical protein